MVVGEGMIRLASPLTRCCYFTCECHQVVSNAGEEPGRCDAKLILPETCYVLFCFLYNIFSLCGNVLCVVRNTILSWFIIRFVCSIICFFTHKREKERGNKKLLT